MTIRLFVLSCAAAGLAACSNAGSPTAPSVQETTRVRSGSSPMADITAATASTAAPDPAAANYEVKFMTGMIASSAPPTGS